MLSFLQPGLDLRPGHDQDHGGADDGHAAEDGEGGGLVEDEDAHGDGGERFAHAQDGGQGGTDALDGQDQGQVGDDRGDDGQQQAQVPMISKVPEIRALTRDTPVPKNSTQKVMLRPEMLWMRATCRPEM